MTFDFDKIYELYPRKLGKSEGIKKCKSKIKTKEQYDNLEKAVTNYAKFTEGYSKEYIKFFSSFMSHWEDWIDWKEEDDTFQQVDIGKIRFIK